MPNLTASAPKNATVGTGSAQALAGNKNRQGLVLVNSSANTIYVAFDAPAVVGSGICLAPNGGAYTMQPATLNRGAIFAIATGAGSNLSIQEFTNAVQ